MSLDLQLLHQPGLTKQIFRPLASPLTVSSQQFLGNCHSPCSFQKAWTKTQIHRISDTPLVATAITDVPRTLESLVKQPGAKPFIDTRIAAQYAHGEDPDLKPRHIIEDVPQTGGTPVLDRLLDPQLRVLRRAGPRLSRQPPLAVLRSFFPARNFSSRNRTNSQSMTCVGISPASASSCNCINAAELTQSGGLTFSLESTLTNTTAPTASSSCFMRSRESSLVSTAVFHISPETSGTTSSSRSSPSAAFRPASGIVIELWSAATFWSVLGANCPRCRWRSRPRSH